MRIVMKSILTLLILLTANCTTNQPQTKFNSIRAYEDIVAQMSLGPRTMGSEAHAKTIEYIQNELTDSGWEVTRQNIIGPSGIEVQNIIGKRGQDNRPWIILGAHYDSRFFADRDPNPQRQKDPVPGANDGASGVAVLLELGRTLPVGLEKQIWLCFFDAEDNGNISGYDWILGSQAFVASLTEYPDSVVIVDMIGDKDLNIFIERNSDRELVDEIWQTAELLGKHQFIFEEKYSILDDHTPFLSIGIPAAVIIDFDYPYWHTTADTIDKVSNESLAAVGETIYTWLVR
jgi:glutaminyl-peptide cyclotransferase